MAIYEYTVIDHTLSVLSGTVVADTPRQARDILRAKGMTVQDIKGQTHTKKPQWWQRVVARRHVTSVVFFLRELSTLLGVGVPLLEAIDTIATQQKGPFQSVLLTLRDRISSGVSLADAMREQPMVFDELCIAVTEVGQSSGSLENALERLAEFKERSLQFKNRVATALMYPCMVIVTGVVVSIFLMTFVVPNLLSTLLESGRELPMATRVVKGASDLLLGWWWLLMAIALALIFAIGLVGRSDLGKRFWHRFQMHIPLIGDMIRKQSIARVALVISTLMRNGVVFLTAMRIAARTTRNLVIREALTQCEASVSAGQDISQALDHTGVFPPSVVRVFAAGQQSGRLEEMLERLAIDYDRQVATASQRLTTILEPVLIVALAVIVGLIAFATMMPILEAGDVL